MKKDDVEDLVWEVTGCICVILFVVWLLFI